MSMQERCHEAGRSHSYPVLATYTVSEERQPGMGGVHIYLLCHPVTSEPAYVGQTFSPRRRLECHSAKPDGSSEFVGWIASLKSISLSPRLDVVEVVSSRDCYAAEQRWIRRLESDGFRLLNGQCCRVREREARDIAFREELARERVQLIEQWKVRFPNLRVEDHWGYRK